MTAEEHAAALWALERADHEEFVAKVRGWLEAAEADGREADARPIAALPFGQNLARQAV